MMNRSTLFFLVLLACLTSFFMVACGEDDSASTSVAHVAAGDGDDVQYGEAGAVVVTENGTFVVSGEEGGEECVEIDGACIDLSEARGKFCGDENAQIDVAVVDGEVETIICYPDPAGGTPIDEIGADADGNVEIPQNSNGGVITFNEDTNGEPIKGDLYVEGNRTIIFGNGVDETIIDGNLEMASNNSRVRGVTIQGNVKYQKDSNGSAISFCKIHGNLDVESNGFTIINCQVFGNVKIDGNNATLINVGVGGNWDVGKASKCRGCYSIDDADGDFVITDEEHGDTLSCDGGEPTPEG